MIEKIFVALIILIISIVICSPMFIDYRCPDCDGELEDMYDSVHDHIVYKCKKCRKVWILL